MLEFWMANENLAFHWLIIISTTLFHGQIRNWVHQQLHMFNWIWIKGCMITTLVPMFLESYFARPLSTTINAHVTLSPLCNLIVSHGCYLEVGMLSFFY
jgi:hypothetical protein